MNNQSARGFYNITETIKSELLKTPNVKTVTVGDLADVDLSKQTIFPTLNVVSKFIMFFFNFFNFF